MVHSQSNVVFLTLKSRQWKIVQRWRKRQKLMCPAGRYDGTHMYFQSFIFVLHYTTSQWNYKFPYQKRILWNQNAGNNITGEMYVCIIWQ